MGLDDPGAIPYLVQMGGATPPPGGAPWVDRPRGALVLPGSSAGRTPSAPPATWTSGGDTVEEMTEAQIYDIADKFGQAAATAKACGFDMVMIHMGHGWLLHQFISG